MKFYSQTVFTTLLFTLLCTGVRAQTTVAVMDFDGTTPEITVTPEMGVPFFDNSLDGFYGIHNANADATDGAPADTGVGNSNDTEKVDSAPISGDFLFVNDLEDEGDNGAAMTTLTFGPVDVSGLTNLLFSFDYQVDGFDNGDDVFYALELDGVAGTAVQFIDGGSALTTAGSIDVTIPDGTMMVSLLLTIDQNGDDAAGFDNFIVTADNTGTPCGITSFGPDATETCLSFNNDAGSPDMYSLSIDYSGLDADAVVAVSVDGNPATSFDTSTGDDPTATSDGTLVITSPDFLEGTSYEVTLTDGGGNCNFTVSGSVATDACVAVCDLAIDPTGITLFCEGFTSADDVDMVSVEIDYTGVEPGTVISAPGLTIGGDDPAVDEDGTIEISGAVEGGSYAVTISGGDCTGGDSFTIPITVPSNLCTPSDLVINEVLADPGSVNDANNDGNFNGSEDEFIELYNTGMTDLDVSGWTISEGAGVRYTFPPGSTMPAMTGFVLFGGGTPNVPCSNSVADTPFIGLNNGGDVVIVRNALGLTVAQMSYGAEGGNDQSVALNPNGDLSGGYVQHTTIPNPGGAPLTHSACFENDMPLMGLPVDLLFLSAQVVSKSVAVSWATANENDNDHFSVERSLNGRQWTAIGKVMAGNRTENEYVFYDEAPLNGNNLYRLRQVDVDGTPTVFGPVAATFKTDELLIFPNPAGPVLRFGGDIASADALTLLSADGQVIRQIVTGTDRVSVNDLKAGLYLLRVERENGVETLRFFKQ